jgi:arsenate reductase (glutaredoxin)
LVLGGLPLSATPVLKPYVGVASERARLIATGLDRQGMRRSMKITVYQKPTCTTCRQVYAALKESGVDFESVNYYTEPLSKAKLKELIRKMGITAPALFRTKEEAYKKLKLAGKDLSDDEAINLMVKHPDLIQRPIVEKGSRAILARPAERLKEIL